MRSAPGWRWRLLAPARWPMWIGMGLVRSCAAVSYPRRLSIGRQVGRVLYRIMGRRRRIAAVNLALCFPEMDESERRHWLRRHFESIGIALVEMGATWWAPAHKLAPLVRIQGEENIDAALSKGKGIIGVSAHLLSTEMGLRLMTSVLSAHAVYRPHNDPVLDYVIQHGRTWHRGVLVNRSNFRAILGALRDNQPVWFPTDQDHGPRHSVFVPFFGQPTATITTPSRLARLSGAPVVPFYPHRLPGDQGYEVVILPPLDNFPSGDDTADAHRLNRLLEEQVRRNIDQYLWVHRRFKTRPPGAENVYASV